jgi:long-chain acyl-CoA synthetase
MYAATHAELQPDKAAIVMAGSGEVVTYAEYEAAANRVAHLFRDAGLRPLDRVAFFMENNPRLLECEGGGERTGLYYVCINSFLSAPEAAYIVNDSGARIVVSTAAKREVALALPELCPEVERWLMVGIDQPSGPWEPYEDTVRRHPAEAVTGERLGAAMLYSSGTTGRPKGIQRPLPDAHPAEPLPVYEFAARVFQMDETMTYLSPAPLYHAAPQAAVAGAIRLGCTTVVMERFDAMQFLELIARHQITHTQVVPTMFSRLLKLPDDVRRAADTSSLRAVIHAAAPCPIPIKEQMIDWLGPIVFEYYSATEGHGFAFCDTNEWLAHKGTVGKPILGEVLILDEDERACPPGTPGTIWFRGATNFEYWRDPQRTAEAQAADGTMSTVDDVGYLDDDGYLYLTDRKSNMIISGGVNIYPQETEDLLIAHPKVMDAAVIGVPNDDLGEEVKAVVQLAAGIAPSSELAQELIEHCRDRLTHFKCPRTIEFIDELPRLPTGKLYKRLLRDRYWHGRSSTIV